MKRVCAKGSESRSKSGSGSGSEIGSESTRRLTRGLSESRGKKIEARVVLRRIGNRSEMPSVGMRRTTRVFGVVKGVDGARVLRSGRRLWPESGEASLRRADDGDHWFKLFKNTGNGGAGDSPLGYKPHHHGWARKEVASVVDVADFKTKVTGKRSYKKMDDDGVNKMFGIVYSRKRKRLLGAGPWGSDRMYGLRFVRRQRGKTNSSGSSELIVPRAVLTVVTRSHCFAPFLSSVLRYINMRKEGMRFTQLSAFLCSEPFRGVYSSSGIHFLPDPPSTSISGVCKFFGSMQSTPLFSVDFSAVPLCFLYMHSRILLRFNCRSFLLVNNSNDDDITTDSEEDEIEEHLPCIPPVISPSECKDLAPEVVHTENKASSHPSVRASRLTGRTTQYRNGLNSRGIRKRRSSLRGRRARNPSLVSAHKHNGALVSDIISNRRNGIPFSSVVSNSKLRSSVRSSSVRQIKELSSTMVGSAQGIDSSCCSVNILVTESDKCYREEGVNVMLELSPSREWVLVFKKDGFTRYTHKAEKVMKPNSSNRLTQAITWNLDNGWKLEFTNKRDWFIFKDLYKECSDRVVPAVKIIPVPWVSEVLGYGDGNNAPFCRPDSYISLKDDEVSRAMARRTANYDMDSEDETWLMNFNNQFFAENGLHERVSDDNFELMVDAFEKAYYSSPDDILDEKAAANLCLDLGRSEVVEAVYSYWKQKRKQKRSALLRVFQVHQAKRPALIPPKSSFLRKRRSFKRQPSLFGRGKQPSVLQAMAAEQDALLEKNAELKVREANVSAYRSVELAIVKRRRAQFLMENADLATYRATMALRIAEAAQVAESPDATVSYFLD